MMDRLKAQSSLIVTGILVIIVMSMVMPIPATLLDLGITLSIATATMILVMASLVDKPTDFQAFPVLLLVSLLLRLSLNVSSTRLILTQGHTGDQAAGAVISGFSDFVASGSLLIGLTVFAVISAVNFMVITKGAGRMAEVSARFALDSLPGKQLAIDGDLNSGAIDHEQAKQRRLQDQSEISFFGSLDGASKFVKGDAVAGIVITLINLTVGIAVGIFSHHMSAAEAMNVYSKLTIGDGLVSQIPSLITSMAAALLLSRGGTSEATADMLTHQLIKNWRAPAVVAASLVALAAVPGMPSLLFLNVAFMAFGLAWWSHKKSKKDITEPETPLQHHALPARRLGDELDMDDISVEIGVSLVASALDEGRGLGARIVNLRIHIARAYGLILPDVRITDAEECGAADYVIRLHGVIRGKGSLQAQRVLALGQQGILDTLPGPVIREPVFSSNAKWVDPGSQEDLALLGATIVTPVEVLSTHLMEVIKSNLASFMTLTALHRMISELKDLSDPNRAQIYQRYFDNMMPEKVAPEMLLSILRQLLEEDISIRSLPLIIDAVYESRNAPSPELIYEAVRKRLRGQITQRMADLNGQINLIQLHPKWEAEFAATDGATARYNPSQSMASLAQKLVESAKLTLAATEASGRFVIATPDHRRRQVREILATHGITIPIMGLEEIDPSANMKLIGTIEAG